VLDRCVLLTDQAVVLYLWESLAQGKECGQLQRRQVEFEEEAAYGVKQDHSEGAQRPNPSGSSHRGQPLDLCRGGRSSGPRDGGERFPHWGAGVPVSCHKQESSGFVNEPMSSDTLRKRLQKRLKDAGLFEGETVHSFRRFAVQHAAVNLNYSVKQLMDLGRWKSYAAFRLYVEEIWRK
jgi:integrase